MRFLINSVNSCGKWKISIFFDFFDRFGSTDLAYENFSIRKISAWNFEEILLKFFAMNCASEHLNNPIDLFFWIENNENFSLQNYEITVICKNYIILKWKNIFKSGQNIHIRKKRISLLISESIIFIFLTRYPKFNRIKWISIS